MSNGTQVTIDSVCCGQVPGGVQVLSSTDGSCEWNLQVTASRALPPQHFVEAKWSLGIVLRGSSIWLSYLGLSPPLVNHFHTKAPKAQCLDNRKQSQSISILRLTLRDHCAGPRIIHMAMKWYSLLSFISVSGIHMADVLSKLLRMFPSAGLITFLSFFDVSGYNSVMLTKQ